MSTESCINTDAHMKKCQKLNVNKLKIAKKKRAHDEHEQNVHILKQDKL